MTMHRILNLFTEQTASKVLCGVLLAVLLLLPVKMGDGANASLPVIGSLESIAAEQCRNTLQKATSAYVQAKIIDKTLSTIQRTEISVTPFGLGMTVAPGEMLAAANEAIERVASALFFVMGLMMVEKLTLGLVSFVCLKCLFPAALVLMLLHLFLHDKHFLKLRYRYFSWAKPASLLLAKVAVLTWLLFPSIAVFTRYIDSAYLDIAFQEQLEDIKQDHLEVEKLQEEVERAVPDENILEKSEQNFGFFASFENIYDSIKQTIASLSIGTVKMKVNTMLHYADNMTDKLFHIFCIFIITTLVIPLLFVFIFVKAVNAAFYCFKSYSYMHEDEISRIMHRFKAIIEEKENNKLDSVDKRNLS